MAAGASSSYRWDWDPVVDRATLSAGRSERPLWQGSLLPLFWVETADGGRRAVKAEAVVEENRGRLSLRIGDLGTGRLDWERGEAWFRITRLEVAWGGEVPKIISLHWGAHVLTPEERCGASNLDAPFAPDWQAEGFCLPSAKGGPIQSFFRFWDFGQATLPLGNFGPSLGTPYAAAFPRPFLAAAMGGPDGWACLGAGAIPDGALTLQIRSGLGALEWLYREDLWGAPAQPARVWEEPLRMHWGPSAWEAYQRYLDFFFPTAPSAPRHQKSHWNSWGDFKEGRYSLPATVDRAVDDLGVEVLCCDDGWESFVGSGEVHAARFPALDEDLAYARRRGLEIGFWQSVGWVNDYAAAGLTMDDLLLNRDGRPVRVNWCMSPQAGATGYYCLDPSSAGAMDFLRRRTRRLVERYGPDLLKLDFAYGLPSPHAAAPRDAALRGERMGLALMKAVADAAREVRPGITLQGYSIHPLMASMQNLLALDDMGDAGGQDEAGHAQWSIWAALTGARGMAICGSSGYQWSADAEILLNTAVLGAPGAVLPRALPESIPNPQDCVARRFALAKWHRRTTVWRPAWLNSEPGRLGQDPVTRCWGRLEVFAGRECLTAVALRPLDEAGAPVEDPLLQGWEWDGAWAVIAQDDAAIRASREVAVIPFGGTRCVIPLAAEPARVVKVRRSGREEAAATEWLDERLVLRHAPESADPALGYLIRGG